MARRRAFSIALLFCALVACGEALGGDDDETLPPRPTDDGGNDGADAPADAATDGGGDSTVDGSPCSANGTLDLDPTFGPVALTLAAPKIALSKTGTLGTVGRCQDAGVGLELARISPTGAITNASTCFGSTAMETAFSITATTQGWAIASSATPANVVARAIHVTADGVKIADDQLTTVSGYPSSYPRFALEVGTAIVWGGFRYGGSPERGFLKVIGAPGVIEMAAGEVPVAAAVSGGRLYVAIVREQESGLMRDLLVKRYDVPGTNLVPDTTFATGSPPSVPSVWGNFDPIGSLLVEGDVVTIAAGQGSVTVIFRLANGVWTQEAVEANGILHLARSCDGALIIGGPLRLVVGQGSKQALMRRVGGAAAGALEMPDPSLAMVGLLRDPSGDLYVAQTEVRRVLP